MFFIFVGSVLAYGASIYALILLVRVAFDWARLLAPHWVPKGVVLTLADWVYKLTDPPIRWMRKFIPPLRLGTIALDVGFLVIFVVVSIIGRIGQYLMYLGYSGG